MSGIPTSELDGDVESLDTLGLPFIGKNNVCLNSFSMENHLTYRFSGLPFEQGYQGQAPSAYR